jgi:hypothetical protein
MSLNAGRGISGSQPMSAVQLYKGAQINFGDLTPCLTYGLAPLGVFLFQQLASNPFFIAFKTFLLGVLTKASGSTLFLEAGSGSAL